MQYMVFSFWVDAIKRKFKFLRYIYYNCMCSNKIKSIIPKACFTTLFAEYLRNVEPVKDHNACLDKAFPTFLIKKI